MGESMEQDNVLVLFWRQGGRHYAC